MHTSVAALREHMPMNIRSRFPNEGRKPGVKEDIDRVAALWRQCRSRYGADGPFLFGRFTIADAVFAPVVTRFRHRTDERRGGQECVGTCRSRWSPYH